MYLIALCDDEADAIQKTEDMLGNYQREHKWLDFAIERFENADMLLNQAKEENYMPDLILMDIYMPDKLGTEVAKELRSMGNESRIIFLTASREHALDAFGVGAVQYLVKPVHEEDLYRVLDMLLKDITEERNKYILIKTDGRIQRVYVNSIVYCEAQRKTQYLYIEGGTKYTLHLTMAEIYGMLSSYQEFVRTGAAYIVNLEYIDSLNSQYISLVTGKKIYLPRGAYKGLKQQYFSYYCGAAQDITGK